MYCFLVFPFVFCYFSFGRSFSNCLFNFSFSLSEQTLAFPRVACYLVTIVTVGKSIIKATSALNFIFIAIKIVDLKFLLHFLQMFDELHEGTTRFSLKISDSCDRCYNVRLLKVITRFR